MFLFFNIANMYFACAAGNIFTHFAPLDWKGPRKAKNINPYYSEELRAKHHDAEHDEM